MLTSQFSLTYKIRFKLKEKNSINYQRDNINTKRDRDGGRFRRNANHELKKKKLGSSFQKHSKVHSSIETNNKEIRMREEMVVVLTYRQFSKQKNLVG